MKSNLVINDLNNKKVLFLIPSGLGDFIKSLGIFLSVKENYPTTILDVAIVNNEISTLKDFINYIDDIITLNIKQFTFRNYFLYFLFKGWKDIKQINSKKYDLIISLTLNPLRRYLLTFTKSKNKIFLPIIGTDVIEEYNFISKSLKMKMAQQQPPLFSKINDLKEMTLSPPLPLRSFDKKNIIINMFCADSPYSLRDWHKWNKLVENMVDKFNIILIGKVNFDYKKYYQINYSNIVDLINKIDLKSLVFLFQECDLIITVDSFPFHLAYAVDTPVIGLFGPIDPETRIPPNIDKKNIFYIYENKYAKEKLMNGNRLKKELKKKNKDIYMDNINVEDVMSKINMVLK